MLALLAPYAVLAVLVVAYAVVLFTDWPNHKAYERLSQTSRRARAADNNNDRKEVNPFVQ